MARCAGTGISSGIGTVPPCADSRFQHFRGYGMGPGAQIFFCRFDAGNDDKTFGFWGYLGDIGGYTCSYCLYILYSKSICLLLMMIGVPLVRNYINVVNMCKSRIRS